jgi:hypothetical protein
MITLATLPQATAQEVFDQVAIHLLTQGEKAVKDGTCLYRTESGLKCAAGALMSDEEYAALPENDRKSSWRNLVYATLAPFEHVDLINSLQHIHDSANVDNWERYLLITARDFNLRPTVVTNFKHAV